MPTPVAKQGMKLNLSLNCLLESPELRRFEKPWVEHIVLPMNQLASCCAANLLQSSESCSNMHLTVNPRPMFINSEPWKKHFSKADFRFHDRSAATRDKLSDDPEC